MKASWRATAGRMLALEVVFDGEVNAYLGSGQLSCECSSHDETSNALAPRVQARKAGRFARLCGFGKN